MKQQVIRILFILNPVYFSTYPDAWKQAFYLENAIQQKP